MFEIVNDFAGIQKSLVPAVNLTTTDNMNRRIQAIEQLITTYGEKMSMPDCEK